MWRTLAGVPVSAYHGHAIPLVAVLCPVLLQRFLVFLTTHIALSPFHSLFLTVCAEQPIRALSPARALQLGHSPSLHSRT